MIPAIQEQRDELQQLCDHYQVLRLDLFGSAAMENYHENESDLDFLVEFQNSHPENTLTPISDCAKIWNYYLATLWTLSSIRPSRTPSSGNASMKPGPCSIMQLESQKYLYDIREAAHLLEIFVAGKTFEDYRCDAMLQAAVERKFEIIGEAMNNLAKIDEAVTSRISDYRRIVDFRNVLSHEYGDVDNRLVWDIVETHLPTLVREIDALLPEE